MENLNKAAVLLSAAGFGEEVDEALADVERFIDQRMLDHAIADIEKNGRSSQWYTMFRKMQNTSDANLRDYYSYLMMMSPQMAKNLMREFVQKEVRSGTFSADAFFAEDGEGGSTQLNMMDAYETPDGSAMGMFTELASSNRNNNPEEITTVNDFLSKFINHPKLSSSSKLVVIARLTTGDAAGRGSMTGGAGLQLNEFVDKLPKEYDQVMAQIKRLIDAGFTMDQINSTMILRGAERTDDQGNKKSVAQLVTNHKINQTGDNVTQVIKDLTGQDVKVTPDGRWDLKPVYRWLMGRSVNEDLSKGEVPDMIKDDGGRWYVKYKDMIWNPTKNEFMNLSEASDDEMSACYTTDMDTANSWKMSAINYADLPDGVDEAAPSEVLRRVNKVIEVLMGGKGSVRTSDLISTLVIFVALAKRVKSPVIKTWPSQDIKTVARKYLKDAKSGSPKAKRGVLAMIMSVIMKLNPRLQQSWRKQSQRITQAISKAR